ncbi:hypothetical protein H4217_000940 [Coemansia sp. RSA 1939]|nr:hypothetical protein H4217_000940 [Coemansia sp. RSA 1939]
MTANMYAGAVDTAHAKENRLFGAISGNHDPSTSGAPATTTAAAAAAAAGTGSHTSTEPHPSRCESPLLPMGQTSSHQRGGDIGWHSRQLSQVSNRQSQMSMMRKDYAIHDAEDDDSEEGQRMAGAKGTKGGRGPRQHMNHRPRMTMPRAKSYRIHTSSGTHASPVRDLSSKLKSAYRKLNPKRMHKSAQPDSEGAAVSNHSHTHTHRWPVGSSSAAMEQHPSGSSPLKLSR